ncbi:haloacid dehalogenase type II [Methylobacterium sp. J-088]|uniref:haloacid dehalogenase type II n=1 Tax=Methylobacterium sp. J-088 TaxID=2836664 RepID=UPI001FB9B701|nr:haloacid dehalogenase type II [Methylobacterium sp. J-088]MCJ2067053.1 haloacid dehalogenase type II [Methylobacterium sp. J-088]
MLHLQPVPKVITFDCYGTLVRWHDTVRSAARAILAGRVVETDAQDRSAALADRLRGAAVERQQRPPFCDYKSVLRSALSEALSGFGLSARSEDEDTLLAILSRIEPHPEVPTALDRLRERYQLAIISNTDDDLIAGTVAAIGVPIDFVVTAEQARAYKPDHRLFLHAYHTIGVTKDETIHVGMGQFTDLKVCHELGIRSVWIDRIGEPLSPDWPPHAKLDDLTGLPALLSVD